MTTRRSTRKAFTLLEILVVVFILTLLMGILFPALNMARVSVKRTKCIHNMQAIVQAILTYGIDNNNRFPPVYVDSDPVTSQSTALPPFGTNGPILSSTDRRFDPNDSRKVLNPYLKSGNYGVLRCPADQGATIAPPAGKTSVMAKADVYGYSYLYLACSQVTRTLSSSDSDYSYYQSHDSGGNYHTFCVGEPATTTYAKAWFHQQGICEVVGDAVGFFESKVPDPAGPSYPDVASLFPTGTASAIIAGAYNAAKTKGTKAGVKGKSGVWLYDLGDLYYPPANGAAWPNRVVSSDYWSRASKKVMLLDGDANNVNTSYLVFNAGFWHGYDPIPDPAAPTDVTKIKYSEHAAFLDGHVGVIQLNLYNSTTSYPMTYPVNTTTQRVSLDHLYY